MQRHDFLWPQSSAWPDLLAQASAQLPAHDAAGHACLQRWPHHGWPVVCARQTQGAQNVAAGLSLPPDADGNKRRIALRLAAHQLQRCSAAPRLADIAAQHPASHVLQTVAQQLGKLLQCALHVYGAYAWASLTGLPYLHPASDLDLLLCPRNLAACRQALQALHDLQQQLQDSLRLDGEIMLPDGRALAWREMLQAGFLQTASGTAAAQQQLLCKSLYDVSLVPVTSLYQAWHREAA